MNGRIRVRNGRIELGFSGFTYENSPLMKEERSCSYVNVFFYSSLN